MVDRNVRDRIAAIPELLPGALPYWRAFFELNEHRMVAIGFSGSIELRLTYVDLSQYAKDNGWMDEDVFPTFCRIIRAMDATWVKFQNRPKEAAQAPGAKL